MSSAVQARHDDPRESLGAEEQKSAAHLGQLSASTYARLPPKMQAACREMARRGEITIEVLPGQSTG